MAGPVSLKRANELLKLQMGPLLVRQLWMHLVHTTGVLAGNERGDGEPAGRGGASDAAARTTAVGGEAAGAVKTEVMAGAGVDVKAEAGVEVKAEAGGAAVGEVKVEVGSQVGPDAGAGVKVEAGVVVCGDTGGVAPMDVR